MKANHVKRERWHDPRVKAARRRCSQYVRSKKRKSNPGSDYDHYIRSRMAKSERRKAMSPLFAAPYGSSPRVSEKTAKFAERYVRPLNIYDLLVREGTRQAVK